jgi:hypothetical protein
VAFTTPYYRGRKEVKRTPEHDEEMPNEVGIPVSAIEQEKHRTDCVCPVRQLGRRADGGNAPHNAATNQPHGPQSGPSMKGAASNKEVDAGVVHAVEPTLPHAAGSV